MSKKVSAKKAGKRSTSSIKPVRVSAQELWLASLGAASLVRKQSASLYDSVVNESTSLRQRGVKLVQSVGGELRQRFDAAFGRALNVANDNYAFVESKVGEGVGRVLGRMGVPSRDDIVELSKRVAELSKQVKLLQTGRKSTLLGDAKAA
ncbi:MAG: phasin family protein [Xanthomonadales bacterium]|nr:phasin family protein [Xanthomonadales bacterium]MCB1641193.1 phasin family protein [Xanthomonadales bacterium]